MAVRIVDYRQIILHGDEITRGVHGTFTTGGAAYLAFFQNFISIFQVFASYP
jgi:hypothetical protein